MVGNDLTCDIEGSKKAALRAVWTPYPRVAPPPAQAAADAVLERLADLPDAIRRLG